VIRVSSIFSQMLQLFSRTEFERAVVEHRAERHARGFSCWGQFVAMLFCHLGRAQSLREISEGVFFVTRMKDNADYGVVERRSVPEHGAVRRDEIILISPLCCASSCSSIAT
jgi:hypothetical protein